MARPLGSFVLAFALCLGSIAARDARQAAAQVTAAPGWLGIAMEKSKGPGGVVVTHVIKGSPAQKAGLLDGDRLVKVDGAAVNAPGDVSSRVAAKGAGAALAVQVVRAGKIVDAKVQLVARPTPEQVFRMDLLGEKLPSLPTLTVASGPGPAAYPALGGRVVLLDLFATWCGPCLQLGPYYNAFQAKYGAQGLTVLAVSSEDPTILAGWSAKNAVTYTVASDPSDSLGSRISAPAIPASVLVDKHGIVREVALGFEASQVKRTEQLIQALLKEP
jgi:thiol-disulfide isomerase/thioredoxin